ncbi:MAG: PEP-CTERM sorting domain-containing protein, partial [Planctomycetota bacterium]
SADDGVGDLPSGPGAFPSVDLIWGNYFFTDTPVEIATVSVAFEEVALGLPVTAFVLDDPDDDGNPSNGSVVGLGTGVTASPNDSNPFGAPDVFVDYAITSQPGGGTIGAVDGGFFVGILLPDQDYTDGINDFPVLRDNDTADGAGWLFCGGGNDTDLNNLAALVDPDGVTLNVGNPDIFGFLAGNPLVRATTVPEPTVLGLAGLAVLGLRRRR